MFYPPTERLVDGVLYEAHQLATVNGPVQIHIHSGYECPQVLHWGNDLQMSYHLRQLINVQLTFGDR